MSARCLGYPHTGVWASILWWHLPLTSLLGLQFSCLNEISLHLQVSQKISAAGQQWCSTGETLVTGTKFSVDIPLRKPDFFVLACIWKCSLQLVMLSLGLFPSPSWRKISLSSQENGRETLGHHQHVDWCLELRDMSTHPSASEGSTCTPASSPA